MYCSRRGLEFCSCVHIRQLTAPCKSSSRRSKALFWHPCTHRRISIHRHIIQILKNFLTYLAAVRYIQTETRCRLRTTALMSTYSIPTLGMVVFWNLPTNSPLQRIRLSDGSLKLYPFQCFLAHDQAVRTIQWCKANRYRVGGLWKGRL